MEIKETIVDGDKHVEVRNCELDTRNYLKLALAIYFSVCITIFLVGTSIHLILNSGRTEPVKLAEYLYSVFVEQMGTLLMLLLISLPVYKYVVSKFYKPSIKFKSE